MSEKTIYPIAANIAENAYVDAENYSEMYRLSIQEPKKFWALQAEKFITWSKPWTDVLTGDFHHGDVRWFMGGKLNASVNCLDRHLATHAMQPAIIWEGDDARETRTLTYQELQQAVSEFAALLKNRGVQKGDRVCIYLPMIPEAAIAMLACARIGAIHSVVFAGFSAESLKTRILDADCRLVITANVGMRAGKAIPLKHQVDVALRDCKNVTTVIVVKRTNADVPWHDHRDYWYHDLMAEKNLPVIPEEMSADDPLFILYTSGSTGKPKGILHGTGGYLVYAAMTFHYVFDYHPSELFWCTADVGWITGHTYSIYGPLLNAATIMMFEGVPNYPTPSRFWEIIDKYQVNIFYTAPTAIRALRREGDQFVATTSRKSLRILGSVGEPINPEAWEWYYQIVGENRCPIVDTWWQTETGGIMISALPGATPLKPGSAAWPFFGVTPKVIDDEGHELPPNQMGKLIITTPWPGMLQTIYGDQERLMKQYFTEVPGAYLTGDQAYRDQDGYFWIAGRSDDVLKIAGHRLGTEEIESALITHPCVSEAAVVGIVDEIKGQAIYAFVTLKKIHQPTDALKKELTQTVREIIGPIAILNHIQWTESLPKTRSGKIMRRILRKIANDETTDLGDLSTLAEPQVVEDIIKNRLRET